MSLAPNTRLGPYQILDSLGSGGMGEVYRARDARLGRDVAIKVLPASVAADPERVRRFEVEARAASALNHPNILTIHDIGTENGVTYLVTELLRGRSLRDLITGPLAPATVSSIATQAARGLAAAHHAGIVHRDLKPENLFVTHDGVCKILDFGLARIDVAAAPGSGSGVATAATLAGTVLGTAGYMAPEQVRGHATDARSDIFSLGVVIQEMLTGRSPFLRESVVESLNAILKEEPAVPTRSTPLGSIASRCLEKDPVRRFQSAGDLAFALEHAGSGFAGASVPPRRRWSRWMIALPVLGIAGVVLVLALRAHEHGPPQVAATPVRSLVVVPFASLSRESSDEYFSAGMTDALTTELSHIGALRVIASHSAARLQDSTRSTADIAKELGVEAIVSGSVLRAGDQVRISARLSEAATDRVLWAESYDRPVSNVLALQSEVTRAIARAIALELSPAEEARLARPASVDPRAVDEYLKGRYLWSRRTEPSVREALEHFRASAQVAPDFALAYAGIADAYLILAAYNYEQPLTVAPLALEALTRAMELDSTAGEPHATRGDFAFHVERNYELAMRHADRAVTLSPGYAAAHIWRGEVLSVLGRTGEAIEEMQRAISLDPMTPFPRFFLGTLREISGDPAQAERDYRAAHALMPGYPAGGLVRLLLRNQRSEEALAVARETVAVDPAPGNVAVLGVAQAFSGDRDGAQTTLDRLRAMASERWVSPLDIASVEASLGHSEEALRQLRAAIDSRDFRGPMLGIIRDIEFDA
ncbi:MAG TPA: protein kinase, partial [Candidatus Krumholzibacteria bacterium]